MSDELEIVANTAQEARVVALVLGEASDFEREEVERLCEENAELAIFRRRISAVHGLLGESKPRTMPQGSAWRLSSERRKAISEKLGEEETIVPGPRRKISFSKRYASIAALVAILILVVGLSAPSFFQPLSKDLAQNDDQILLGAEIQKESGKLAPSLSRLRRKPNSPSSSTSRVIASKPMASIAVPIPDLEQDSLAELSEDAFGEAADFGSGWGEEGSAVSRGRQAVPAEINEQEGDAFADFQQDESPLIAGGENRAIASSVRVQRNRLLAEVDRNWENPSAGFPVGENSRSAVDQTNFENLPQVIASLKQEVIDSENLLEKGRLFKELNKEPIVQFAIESEKREELEKLGVLNTSVPRLRELENEFFELKKDADQLRIYCQRLASLDENQLFRYANEIPVKNNPVSPLYAQLSDQRRIHESLLAKGLGKSHPEVQRAATELARLQAELKVATKSFVQELKAKELALSKKLALLNDPEQAEQELAAKKKQLEKLQKQLPPEKPQPSNEEKEASLKGDSTFSLHVSDVSFQLTKAALAEGRWPETVRVEEFVNAFSYREQSVAVRDRIGFVMEQAAHPTLPQRDVVRIALQTAATGRGSGVPLRLTVVLDKSGSMERPDRARAVAEAFRVLVDQLGPQDRVTLIGFSRRATLLAEQLTGNQRAELLEILRQTPSEGGTNLEEALVLARTKAKEHFHAEAQNRIILLTDGIANLGQAVPENLMTLIEQMREEEIAFDACGVGVQGVNDAILEALTRKGDGRYYLLGNAEENSAAFAKNVAGALRPAAKNVKVQIEWNPDRVGKWRLYGFENHKLQKEDFRNDQVDAAELAAAEAGVALYHVEVKPDGEGPIGVVRTRFYDVAQGEMVERSWRIDYKGEASPFSEADAKLRLATVAGLTAEKLARSAVGSQTAWEDLLEVTRQLRIHFPREERVQDLEVMIEQAKNLE